MHARHCQLSSLNRGGRSCLQEKPEPPTPPQSEQWEERYREIEKLMEDKEVRNASSVDLDRILGVGWFN